MSTESHVHGDDPDTGDRAVPPYEGRRRTADVDGPEQSVQDGARTAGATGPVEDDSPKGPDPTGTERGAVASPSDEQPAGSMPQSEHSEPGVGPAHVACTSRGEDLSEE